MKNVILTVILCLSAATFGAYLGGAFSPVHTGFDVTKFRVTSEKINDDIQGRYVVVPPGQAWGFAPDQKLNVKVLQKKPADDGVFVYAELSAEALLPPFGKEKEKEKEKPTTVYLNGVGKLYYEMVAGEWYLVEITSINLRATQK
jgi:hypothetical protein